MGKRLSVAVQGFHPSSFLSEETARLRELLQEKKIISAISGGVDSTVATMVAREALGDKLLPIMIDTGFLRAGEPERVKERLATSPTCLTVRLVHASGRLLASVKGETTAEEKIRVLKEATKMVETSLAPFNYEQYFAAVIENRFAKDPSLETVSETASEALGLPESEVHTEVFEDRVTGVKGDQRCYGLLAGVKLSEESRETYGWLQYRLRQLQAGIGGKFTDR